MTALPADLAACREALGPDFAADFLACLGSIGVDVVRVAELTTAYSFWMGEHAVIAIPASGNWFKQNFDLAHELGHLCLGHTGILPENHSHESAERQANAFAAELLMPAATLNEIDWQTLDPAGLADLIWTLGISTQALSTRLSALHISTTPVLNQLLQLSTQALLRKHWTSDPGADPITARMSAASTRHFPQWLQHAHLERIAAGSVHKETLAWMLGVDVDDLEVDEPTHPESATDADLLDLLG